MAEHKVIEKADSEEEKKKRKLLIIKIIPVAVLAFILIAVSLAWFTIDKALDLVIDGLEKSGVLGARKGFKKAISIMKNISYDRTNLKPQILIVGEYLLNFHPGANHDIWKKMDLRSLKHV